MGEVYRATDTVLDRTVAVKVLAERHARDPDIRARFEREGRAAARLSGVPSVITIFDVGEHDGRPFIVMEYVSGGSVADRLRAGRPDREQALEWLEQTARALDAAHGNGIVHRDVKPANLLLDEDGAVKVSDFGIASASGLDTLTLPGTVLGTAGYLSPEQARGEPATPASDRYALAVVAFELLTGRRPYADDTPVSEALRHVNDPIPQATSIAPELPRALDGVFACALAKRPEERPTRCAELVASVRRALEDEGVPTLVTAPAQPMLVRRHRSRVSWAAFGVVAAVVLASGVALAALVGVSGEPDRQTAGQQTARQQQTATQATTEQPSKETTTQTEASSPRPDEPSIDAAALNDEGYRLMLDGRLREALPVLTRAVRGLAGSGTSTEAYASYNLAYTRFALGSCSGVLALLDRSESVQGYRDEIDALRARARDACLGGEAEGDQSGGRRGGKTEERDDD
jgi:serine/threonine protein kinase